MIEEARAVIEKMGLHEVLLHSYTPDFHDSTAAYIFGSRLEFNHYFYDNQLFLQPNITRVGIIKVLDDGTVIASKWACDKIITAQKRRNLSYERIDKTCGTCEYSLKADDIARHASEAGDDYYDTMQEQIGSCCLGKTLEQQRASGYVCEQYKPDYEAIETTYKVFSIQPKRGRRG